MINYDAGYWGVSLVCRTAGSVFPKALVLAIPNAILAFLFHAMFHGHTLFSEQYSELGEEFAQHMSGVSEIWTSYTAVLGFLIVFRNNQAYTRFWEGATLIHQVRGEWFNAVSSLFAFCSRDPEKEEEVLYFQFVLVRLASLLHCFALQQVCELRDDSLEVIKVDTMQKDSLDFLRQAHDKCEVVIQWMQRLVVDANDSKVLIVAPPILSRVFQELSRGIVNLNNVRKIRDIPFPFPYAQMITCMLIVHWIMTPMIAAATIATWWWSSLMCFFVVTAFWSLFYIALEIDQPFGEDANDLPIKEMQQDFNKSILLLMEETAQFTPRFEMPTEPGKKKRHSLTNCNSDIDRFFDPHEGPRPAASRSSWSLLTLRSSTPPPLLEAPGEPGTFGQMSSRPNGNHLPKRPTSRTRLFSLPSARKLSSHASTESAMSDLECSFPWEGENRERPQQKAPPRPGRQKTMRERERGPDLDGAEEEAHGRPPGPRRPSAELTNGVFHGSDPLPDSIGVAKPPPELPVGPFPSEPRLEGRRHSGSGDEPIDMRRHSGSDGPFDARRTDGSVQSRRTDASVQSRRTTLSENSRRTNAVTQQASVSIKEACAPEPLSRAYERITSG